MVFADVRLVAGEPGTEAPATAKGPPTNARHPRQGQTRRKAGTQSYGPAEILPGFRRVARLPNGWADSMQTMGPVPAFRRARVFQEPRAPGARRRLMPMSRPPISPWLVVKAPPPRPVR